MKWRNNPMTKTIKITKKDGEILHKEYVLNSIENTFMMLANGSYTIVFKKDVMQRTDDQNKLFWLWAKCIENETGQIKEDIHDYYCTMFLRRQMIINGIEKTVIGGTSKLNTAQFANFLKKIQADAAAEFGITLPDPDDLHFEQFKEYYEKYL